MLLRASQRLFAVQTSFHACGLVDPPACFSASCVPWGMSGLGLECSGHGLLTGELSGTSLAGPVLSLLYTIFIIASFGWLPGLATGLVCLGADAATYYWNW